MLNAVLTQAVKHESKKQCTVSKFPRLLYQSQEISSEYGYSLSFLSASGTNCSREWIDWNLKPCVTIADRRVDRNPTILFVLREKLDQLPGYFGSRHLGAILMIVSNPIGKVGKDVSIKQ